MMTSAGVLRRLAGETERVAHEVGDVLHLGSLVVVREHHGIAPPGELADLLLQLGDLVRASRGWLDDGSIDGAARSVRHAVSRLEAAGG